MWDRIVRGFWVWLGYAPSSSPAPAPSGSGPVHMRIAMGELGQAELPGKASNKRIEGYFTATSLGPSTDDVPHCAAFVNWVLKQASMTGTNAANARSFLRWGKPTDTPSYGDIVVFWRKSPSSWEGHVGFFISDNGSKIEVLGANQRDTTRNVDSVNVKFYSKAQVLGYRTPSTPYNSRTVQAAIGIMAIGPLGTTVWDILSRLDMSTVRQLEQIVVDLPPPLNKPASIVLTILSGYIILERVRKVLRLGV